MNDIEDLLQDIRDYLQTNLNTDIAAINTEKTDYDIDTITADDKHFVLGGAIVEFPINTFVNISLVGEMETKNVHGNIAIIPEIMIEVAFYDSGKPTNYTTSLRYMRAVQETMSTYADLKFNLSGFEMELSIPAAVSDGQKDLVVSGVRIKTALS